MGIVWSKIKMEGPIDKNRPFVIGSARLTARSGDTMANVGDKVPGATLRMMGPEGPKAMTTEELFAPGKTVVAFALPGAFTPT
jgi:hypothetical protein